MKEPDEILGDKEPDEILGDKVFICRTCGHGYSWHTQADDKEMYGTDWEKEGCHYRSKRTDACTCTEYITQDNLRYLEYLSSKRNG